MLSTIERVNTKINTFNRLSDLIFTLLASRRRHKTTHARMHARAGPLKLYKGTVGTRLNSATENHKLEKA